jgi:uncharacterized protein (UPF0276 family)
VTRFDPTPATGAGIGLRAEHYEAILTTLPAIPWFEALTENYLGEGGLPLYHLERIRNDYPVALHGVGMSLGSVDPLNLEYLDKLKSLAKRLEPAAISDHLAWVAVGGRYVHDLLPLPYTEEALKHVADRVIQAQDFLGCRLMIENPSSYLCFKDTDMSEAEFLCALTQAADCDLLLDVNNAFVSGTNNGFDPERYIEELPAERITEIHLAGYEEQDGYLFDTHGFRVHPPVWDLFRSTLRRTGPVPTLIEWDTDIPPLKILMAEAATAQRALDAIS